MTDYPEWIGPRTEPPEIDVDWDALTADWRERDFRVSRLEESPAQHANLIRAQVVTGIISERELRFAEWLIGR